MKLKYFYFISYIYLLVFLFFGLINPYLWLDEAGQFFISIGLNHFSEPLSPKGSYLDMISNNNEFNLDPGGFSVLLFFWLKLSTNLIWIKILPYVFFAISVFFMLKISKILIDKRSGLAFGFFLFLIPQLVFRALELRAYTMETFAIIFSIFILINYQKASNKELFIYSIISAFLISSRYSAIILYGLITIFLSLNILFSHKNIIEKIKSILIFSLPLLISVFIIYLFILRNQNPDLSKVDYVPYLSDNFYLFFDKTNLIHSTCLMVLIAISIFDKKLPKDFKPLFHFTIGVNFIFILISFFGLYPYSPFDERNLAVFIFTFFSIFLWLTSRFSFIKKILNYKLTPIFFTILFTILFNLTIKNNWRKNNIVSSLKSQELNNNSLFYVEREMYPSIKYLFEFEKLYDNLTYPENFIFLNKNYTKETFQKNEGKDSYIISAKNLNLPYVKNVGYNLYKIN